MTHRRFELHRDSDVTGISGTGVVAEGIAFTDGVVALRWRSEWPTSVVFHESRIAEHECECGMKWRWGHLPPVRDREVVP